LTRAMPQPSSLELGAINLPYLGIEYSKG
jgi:hypothetical protein